MSSSYATFQFPDSAFATKFKKLKKFVATLFFNESELNSKFLKSITQWCIQTPNPPGPRSFGEKVDLIPNPERVKILFWVLSSLIHFRESFFKRNISQKCAKIAKISFTSLYSFHKIFSTMMSWECPMKFCVKYV